MTPTLNRRLQLLIDDERFHRLERLADERRTSVAALVRDAIDAAYFTRPEMTREEAAAYLLDAPPLDMGDPEDWQVELRASLHRELP